MDPQPSHLEETHKATNQEHLQPPLDSSSQGIKIGKNLCKLSKYLNLTLIFYRPSGYSTIDSKIGKITQARQQPEVTDMTYVILSPLKIGHTLDFPQNVKAQVQLTLIKM